jgi:pyruvate,water dikinase
MSVEEAHAKPPVPVRIPIPANFPIAWANPEEERLSWAQDRMHNPDPLPPLEEDFWARVYVGAAKATKSYEMPVAINARCFNTYAYMAVAPAVPPEQMEKQGALSEQRIKEAIGRLEELWTKEWLPEIQSHLAWWSAFDLAGAPMPALLAHFAETLERAARLWELHFRIVLPTYMAISQFDDLHRDLFGSDGAFSAFRLLQGFDNKTLETGREMWALSRKARSLPYARKVLSERAPDEVMKALEETPEGRGFRDELRAYLDVYGQRGDKWGLSYPSWIEKPDPVIKNLKDYVDRTDRNPDAEQAALVADREAAIASARTRLEGYPQKVVEQFESLLKVAQLGTVLSEDHGFWIDFNSTYSVRRVIMEFGRRLAEAGQLQTADDVFFVRVDELSNADAPIGGPDLRPRVAERRAIVEHFSGIMPPPVVGTDYGPPPDGPVTRFWGKFFGGPPPQSTVPNLLKGHAGSPGKVRGNACVIKSLEEAGKLKFGDILVAQTTAPPWTPLFATAAAIVTDTGGILSHCAVVAREYRIPAVVGTGRATAVIRDGQVVEVDGDSGSVRIVGE